MMGATKRKNIPKVKTEEEERTFWKTINFRDDLDWSQSERLLLPTLRPSLKTISLRLPESMIEELKRLAHKRDIPDQSLLKILPSEKIKEEQFGKPTSCFSPGNRHLPDSMIRTGDPGILGLQTGEDLTAVKYPQTLSSA